MDLQIGGQRYLDLCSPLYPRLSSNAGKTAQPIGYLRLGLRYEFQGTPPQEHLVGLGTVSVVLIAISIALSIVFTRMLVAPLRRLTRAAKLVAAGQLDVRVPVTSRDELGVLTRAFNKMTSRLAQAHDELRNYQEKLEDNQRTLEDKVARRTEELEIATRRAYQLAQHDLLTGLPNRALLGSRLKQIVAQAAEQNQHVALLFLDLDLFKRMNDKHGHETGDKILRAAAQRLVGALSEDDLLARLGGDEFVAVLPALEPSNAAEHAMERASAVLEAMAKPFEVEAEEERVTCSIGVALYPVDAADGAELIKQADAAMYAAKEQGRNCYRFFTPDLNTQTGARLQLEQNLRRGLANDEFFLVYQPQIDIGTGWPVGVEALLRWRDPERGVIGPSEFIAVAEESGLIHPLGSWVLGTACRQACEWHRHDMPMRLSVNLSVHQLEHEDWISLVREALEASGLPPRYLDLEITESVIISNAEKAVATLLELKKMGVTITMDDFGTGYSSLNYLARLPLHSVKIDQKFVHGLTHNRNDATITQAIIALSHSLGIRVIAEGVESPQQYRFLHDQGCEEAQGFYISQPLEAEAIVRWWRERMEMANALDAGEAAG
jgi:diguanylate cyclase (GGDEF)-like protein